MEYLQESGVSIYRRRRRIRAVITLTLVSALLLATVLYAAAYVQKWVGTSPPKPVAAACSRGTSNQPVKPGGVTVNVYNTTARTGLAAFVADKLRAQGFKVAAVDNDPLGMMIAGVGEIRHGQAGAAAAILAASRLSGARIVQDDRTDGTVDVVLGNTFTTLSALPKGARPAVTPTPTC